RLKAGGLPVRFAKEGWSDLSSDGAMTAATLAPEPGAAPVLPEQAGRTITIASRASLLMCAPAGWKVSPRARASGRQMSGQARRAHRWPEKRLGSLGAPDPEHLRVLKGGLPAGPRGLGDAAQPRRGQPHLLDPG